MPVSSARTSASRTQAGSSAKPLTSTVRNLPPTPQRSSPISKATASSQAVTTKSSLPSNLVDCRICGRHFAADRVAKHEEVCQKSSKKRKPFDALQQRVKGTEVEKYVRKSSKTLRSQPEVSIFHLYPNISRRCEPMSCFKLKRYSKWPSLRATGERNTRNSSETLEQQKKFLFT